MKQERKTLEDFGKSFLKAFLRKLLQPQSSDTRCLYSENFSHSEWQVNVPMTKSLKLNKQQCSVVMARANSLSRIHRVDSVKGRRFVYKNKFSKMMTIVDQSYLKVNIFTPQLKTFYCYSPSQHAAQTACERRRYLEFTTCSIFKLIKFSMFPSLSCNCLERSSMWSMRASIDDWFMGTRCG